MTQLFLDFDGTLIDSKERLYKLFSEMTPEFNISFEEYWKIKRNDISQEKILRDYLGYSYAKIKEFKQNWLAKIEEEERLIEDIPFSGVTALLTTLNKRYDLFLVTSRQKEKLVYQQLDKFGWSSLFKQCLVTAQTQTKDALIKKNINVKPKSIIIGDTCEDIKTGKILGMQTFAVYSGTLSPKILKRARPDLLAKDLLAYSSVL